MFGASEITHSDAFNSGHLSDIKKLGNIQRRAENIMKRLEGLIYEG